MSTKPLRRGWRGEIQEEGKKTRRGWQNLRGVTEQHPMGSSPAKPSPMSSAYVTVFNAHFLSSFAVVKFPPPSTNEICLPVDNHAHRAPGLLEPKD